MSVLIAVLIRLSLVALFLPFSAWDKLVDMRGAVRQARQIGCGPGTGQILIMGGLFIEVVMSLGVLTGIADRMAALILAAYCVATAILYKQFWTTGDFRFNGSSTDQTLFWDFWKNIALAGGFLLITFGTQAETVRMFFAAPLSSTHPYSEVTR